MKLLMNALTKFICGVVLVGVLIFLPAGTLGYFLGWLFMGLLFGPMLIAGLVMLFKSPEFLEKRLDAKEKQAAQRGGSIKQYNVFGEGLYKKPLKNGFRPSWSEVQNPTSDQPGQKSKMQLRHKLCRS